MVKYPYPIKDNPNEIHTIVQNCTSQKEQSNCSSNAPPIDSHEDPTDMPDHVSTKMLSITTRDPGKYHNSGKHHELTEYNNELVSDSENIEHIRFLSKRLKKKPSYLTYYDTVDY
ncbi:hypothetical protein GJ496_010475 [Pomphorhynchus laevis]|nr:hypothetical protein GJ496_010475 [Pomphorhynchus laevis]